MGLDITQKSRSDLKSYFVRNAIPTEGNFADLIDSLLNQRDDGIVKAGGDPLSIEAAGDEASQKKAVNLYLDFADDKPSWVFSLRPRSDPKKPGTARPGFSISDGDGNSRLCIRSDNGRVGIGTVEPQQQLEVAGTIVCHGLALARSNNDRQPLFLAMARDFNHALYNNYSNVDGEGAWDGSKWNTFAGLDIRVGAGGNKKTAIKVLQNGNVGIGNPRPRHKLHVSGNAVASGTVFAGAFDVQNSVPTHVNRDGVFYRTGGQVYITVDDNLYIRDTDGRIRMHFQTNSGVFQTDVLRLGNKFRLSSIGDAHGNDDWLRMFDVNNRGYYGGLAAGRLWTQQARLAGSDRRMKTDIGGIRDALGKVTRLRGVGFRWKDGRLQRQVHMGFVAQEVETVVPELVETGPNGMKALEYDGVIALLVEAVKSQQKSIKALDKRLDTMASHRLH